MDEFNRVCLRFSAHHSRFVFDRARLPRLPSILVCGYHHRIARIQRSIDRHQFTEFTRFGTQFRGHTVRTDQFLWHNHGLHHTMGRWKVHQRTCMWFEQSTHRQIVSVVFVSKAFCLHFISLEHHRRVEHRFPHCRRPLYYTSASVYTVWQRKRAEMEWSIDKGRADHHSGSGESIKSNRMTNLIKSKEQLDSSV